MRLDLFLKLSRLCPRRSIAQQLCDAGFVLLNGRAAKSAHAVKENDLITVRHRHRETTVRVTSVPAGRNVSRQAANEMIHVIAERDLPADI
ncbi:MAG TPA: S4 domain-containing protein [Pyrinomonadaceae bacterium]|jgi:ribosomal 50S subunit-recycling heat shock protein|nr:S4 domain-containing protein [Pyrinomonadaceae bacterium]